MTEFDNNNGTHYADLHVHTTASDGSCDPAAVVEKAHAAGFAAIAISDHDTVSGIDEAMIRGAELGVEIIPAVELSAGLEIEELHVLGYFIDHRNPELLEALENFRQHRVVRVQKMISLLQGLGIPANYDEFSFEYRSNAWSESATGVPKTSFTADTDTCIYPDRVMVLGTKLKYFEAKGFDTTALYRDYLAELETAIAQDTAAANLSFAPRPGTVLIGYDNIPDSGYGTDSQ